MKKNVNIVPILALVLASLACQSLTGGGDEPQPQPLEPVDGGSGGSSDSPGDPGYSFDTVSDFPLTDDAQNVIESDGTVIYQTEMSVEEVMEFYRDVLTAQGYTERDLLTTLTDGVFSFVFDGHESGQALVIQGFDLKNGTTNVSIRLEQLD